MNNEKIDNEEIYFEIIENMREGAYFTNTDRRIVFWNKAAENITGYKRKEILGKTCQSTLLNHIDSDGNLTCVSGCPLHHTLNDGQRRKHEVFLRNREGKRIAVSVNTLPVIKNEKIVGAIEIFTPSSLVIYDDELIIQLSNSAMNDKLTGIPNRRRVENFLDLRLREMAMYKYKICVVFLDIDNFRNFNNTYGHDAGDAVLKTVSNSVMRMTRNTDLFGRWGGEEFVGIYTIKENSDTLLIGEKIRALVEDTQIKHGDLPLSVTVSIGVAVAREEDTIDSVVKRADELMYKSKQNGKNCVTADTE
ncbi:MAG: sensor domain-containing diguanylate cyclase [Oscillospiraceae bacterium]|nr:sensor domain-containing diguanylate cyclase [Oscillospiraceae bacterium]